LLLLLLLLLALLLLLSLLLLLLLLLLPTTWATYELLAGCLRCLRYSWSRFNHCWWLFRPVMLQLWSHPASRPSFQWCPFLLTSYDVTARTACTSSLCCCAHFSSK
jgi:hypothetical protein